MATLGSISRRQAGQLMVGAMGSLWSSRASAQETRARMLVSRSITPAVNIADAKAALQVWLKHINDEMGIAVSADQGLFEPTQLIIEKLRAGKVDAVALNAIEFRAVAEYLDTSEVITTADPAHGQYALLARRESGIAKLADLKGRRLDIMDAPHLCLAGSWLQVLLSQEHLAPPERFFESINLERKPAQVILPVFFGRADACICDMRTFQTMGELNPQIPKQLKVLAVSAELSPSFYVFAKSFRGEPRAKVTKALTTIQNTQIGRQLMTLFQFNTLVIRKGDCLTSALALLEAAERVTGKRAIGERGNLL